MSPQSQRITSTPNKFAQKKRESPKEFPSIHLKTIRRTSKKQKNPVQYTKRITERVLKNLQDGSFKDLEAVNASKIAWLTGDVLEIFIEPNRTTLTTLCIDISLNGTSYTLSSAGIG